MPDELDTATLPAPETAESVTDDQPQDIAAPETPEVVPPETEDSEEAPETEADPEPERPKSLDELSDEEIEENARIKDLLARRQESARRKAEADTQKRIAEQRKQSVTSGNLYKGLQQLAQQAAESIDGRVNPQHLNAIANDLWAFTTTENYNAFKTVLDQQIPEDFRVPQKLQNKFDDAYDNLVTGKGTWDDVVKAKLDITREAWRDSERPAMRKEIEKEVRESLGLETKTEKQRSAERNGRGGSSPSNVNGSPGSSRSTSEVLADPNASTADKEAAFAREYGEIRLPAY